jgi:GNAT superfamily N-acetyltransferase
MVMSLNKLNQHSWDVARFDYWYWHIAKNLEKRRLEDMIFLWEDSDGEIRAVLVPDGPGEAYFLVHPDIRDTKLEEEMLLVAEERLYEASAEGQRKLRIWAQEKDTFRRDLLARHGYSLGEWPEYQRRRSMDLTIPAPKIPPGYTVRPLGDGLELLERCFASGVVFHPDDIQIALENRSDPAWYRNIQTAPLYRRDLDIVAIAPDGAVAAFCTIWFDDVNRIGVFEPVGTMPAHQKRGLGKAVMLDGLQKLKKMGAVMAFVGSYSEAAGALYASVGFTEYDLSQGWSRTWL